MEEPSPRSSRLALAGALAAAIAVGGAGFLLGRSASERPAAVALPPIAAPAPKPAPEPSSGLLGRADLIALAAAAADSAASGRDPGPEVTRADGRRFELRLPFGCAGPAAEDSSAPMRWSYDPKAQALRIAVDPVAWAASDWWPAEGAGGVEAVEGFWVARPWTSSEDCPESGDRPAAGTEPVTLPGQTLALGQVFQAEGGRGGRRDGKPFEAVVRVAEADLKAARGFRLRLAGRVAATPGRSPVRCLQPAGPEQRPICLVGIVMDEVAVENSATGETLATWSLAGAKAPEG